MTKGDMDGITDSMDMSLSKSGFGDGHGDLACCSLQGSQRFVHDWENELN